jgi:DNA-binding transcriptional ArsR family regulator
VKPRAAGRFAYPELDRVLHERARLGILSSLVSCGAAVTFADLKELCDLTDGNLSRHLKALEEAGVVALERNNANVKESARPQTWIAFTKGGRKRFLDYVDVLESIVQNSAAAKSGRRAGFELGVGRAPA